MKPLLIIPPAPSRWMSLEELLSDEPAAWLDDLRARLSAETTSEDALAIVPSGSRTLASACIRRKAGVGVLGHVFTREDHRRRGLARRLLQTLLSWFDMTRGRRLFATADEEIHRAFLEHFGFRPLGPAVGGRLALLRELTGTAPEAPPNEPPTRELTRGDWPLLVELLRSDPAADPRVTPEENLVSAEATVMDLFAEQERGVTRLLGSWDGGRLRAFASVSLESPGNRTFAMNLPHGKAPVALREAVRALAAQRGYDQVQYPLEENTPARTESLPESEPSESAPREPAPPESATPPESEPRP